MKKLILLSFLFTGCASVRFVTVNHGQVVDDHNRKLNIVGNPRITCYNDKNEIVADGYFVYENDDKSFLVDEFGKQYVTVKNPKCRLGSNE